jgi:hypothetical protein
LNQEVMELECLSAAKASGQLPDGCDSQLYVRLGLIEKDRHLWRLTAAGMRRLAELGAATAAGDPVETSARPRPEHDADGQPPGQ